MSDETHGLPPAAESAPTLPLRHLQTAARYLCVNLLPLPLVVIGMAALMRSWQSTRDVVLWATATIATWLVTIAVLRSFLKREDDVENVTRWAVVICAALLVSTSAFASVSLFFWVENDRLNNVLLYVIIAAGLANAGAQSAPSIPVVATNLAPYCVVFLYLALRHEVYPINLGMAALQVCYIGLVALYARAVWQLSHEMLVLRDEKRSLIGRLQYALDDATGARRRAETASQAKSNFLANMSHELRTPLNAVLGFSEVIRDRTFGPGADERYSNYAADIHTSGRHLLRLIDDILDLSKIEAGRRELKEQEIDLAACGRAVLQFIEPQARARNVQLVFEPRPLPALFADELAIRQIVINLLSNAVKFTPRHGRVTLAMNQIADGGVQIVVADNGIARADLDHVLESFAQGRHDVVTTEERGSGLGLAIVKGLVELHGGALRIASEVGAGTVVTVTLPAERLRARAA